MLAQEISKDKPIDPELTIDRNEMKVMGSHRGRGLTKPVHDVGTVRVMHVLQARRGWNRGPGTGQRMDAGHNIDDGFSAKAWNGGAANVLNRASKPGTEVLGQK